MGEAIFQVVQGAMFAAIGLVVLALTSWVLLYAIGAVLIGISGLFSWRGVEINLFNPWLAGGALLVVLTLSFRSAYKLRWGMDYSGADADWRSRDSGHFDRGSTESIREIVFAGPGMFNHSIECVARSRRLIRLSYRDLLQVATLFVWLFDRGRKATVQEISAELPEADAIRIIPQLRDMPGVIWLTYHHGVIILSQELRQGLAEVFHQSLPPRSPEPEPAIEDEPPADRDYSASSEAVEWYLALNLPPFASLTSVKRRYRQLAKLYHPDAVAARRPGSAGASDEQFKRINSAYHNILEKSKGVGA
jgi:hypothetical protein